MKDNRPRKDEDCMIDSMYMRYPEEPDSERESTVVISKGRGGGGGGVVVPQEGSFGVTG